MPNTREKRLVAYDPVAFGEFTQSLKNTLEVYDPYSDGYEDGVERIEDWLEFNCIANGVTFAKDNNVPSKWIPVTERLPEIVSTHKRYRSTIKKSIRVLCVCVQKSGKTMVKEGYCEWYNDYPEPRWQIPGTIDAVTHWMPLPEPPKGE